MSNWYMMIAVEDWEQQKKWAELGKLAVEAAESNRSAFPCPKHQYDNNDCLCIACHWTKWCQKRKELDK